LPNHPVLTTRKGDERLEPLGNKVLVRRDPEVTKLDSGIILPDISHSPTYLGTVEAVGPGLDTGCPKCRHGYRQPLRVKVGDRVILPDLGGQEIKDWDGGAPLVIIEEDFLHGRVI
jgi:co-chaperonin GroES (HSP10)